MYNIQKYSNLIYLHIFIMLYYILYRNICKYTKNMEIYRKLKICRNILKNIETYWTILKSIETYLEILKTIKTY